MTVKVRGRVPRWSKDAAAEQAAQHIQERLHALEVALAGGAPQFVSPSTPTFGSGPVVAPGGGGGGGGGGGTGTGVTDHGALTGLADDDHPQYTEGLEPSAPRPHVHGPDDILLLDTRFYRRSEAVRPVAHTHQEAEIVDRRPPFYPSNAHSHNHSTQTGLDADDHPQYVFMARIFGG